MSIVWINSEWNVVKKDNSMTKLETNALRIAELIGLPTTPSNTYVFEQYNGLMPIVFECNSVFANNVSHQIGISRYFVSIHIADLNQSADVVPEIDSYSFEYNLTEPECIEALQECVIKYLELKNGIS